VQLEVGSHTKLSHQGIGHRFLRNRKRVSSGKKQQQQKTTQTVEPRLLSIKQAAQYLNCTVWATRSLAWNRAVSSLKIGNRILFDRADLDAFIEQQKAQTSA
jgi:excisionase family DNA binding protein